LTHCVFRFLLGASKIATDLFAIKLFIYKGLVSLVTFLWHFKKLLTLDTCMISSILLCVLWWSTKCEIKTKVSNNFSAYLFITFLESTPFYPRDT